MVLIFGVACFACSIVVLAWHVCQMQRDITFLMEVVNRLMKRDL